MISPSLKKYRGRRSASLSAISSGYDAVKSSKRRKSPHGRIRSEDTVLKMRDRQKMSESSTDLYRNFSAAAWCIRKHLDFVTRFAFEAKTDDPGLNKAIEERMSWHTKPVNCHSRGLHRFGRLLRLWECLRVMHGDCGILRKRDGSLQTIEHDRIRNPGRSDVSNPDQFVNGVKLSKGSGRHLAYAIHTRNTSGTYDFERTVKASDCHLFGYFFREDQDRGVSPLSSAINSFRDAYEGIDYTLARMKISQLFGLAIYSEENEGKKLSLDFGAGPQVLQMGETDKAEFLESQQPSFQLQQFYGISIGMALKALDIPYSFYDENYTNFHGGKTALMQYLQSAAEKREDVKELLTYVTTFWLALDIVDGWLELPSGKTLFDLKFEWVPRGLPWWDMTRDVTAINKAIESGIMTRTQFRREFFADDWETDVLPVINREKELLAGTGQPAEPAPSGNGDELTEQLSELKEMLELATDNRGQSERGVLT